ncbi:MAG: TonB-dependent receptor [Pseudomonadota bacterium]
MTLKPLCFSVAVALALPASAQDLLEEIIVTARKTEESLQEVPVAVSVVTADVINDLQIENLEDIAKFTPGLLFENEGTRDSNRPVIRGQANILGFSGVSYFIDGVYITGTIADYDLNDIERIEVVKGPQSALYGRNTYSGAINIITKSPGDELSSRLRVMAGEHGRREVNATVKGPLTDTISGGVTIRTFNIDGEFTNLNDGQDLGGAESQSVSAVLAWNPTDALDVRFRGYYSSSEDFQGANFVTAADENNCLFDDGQLYGGAGRYFCGEIGPRQANVDLASQFVDGEPIVDVGNSQVSLNVSYDLNDAWTLRSISGYNKRNDLSVIDGDYQDTEFQIVNFTPGGFPFTGFPTPPFGFGFVPSAIDFTFSNRSRTEDFSQELRLEYDSGDRVRGMIGAYYYNENSDTRDTRVLPPGAQAIADANFGAVFGQELANCAANPICGFVVPFGGSTIDVPRDVSQLDVQNTALFGMFGYDLTDDLSLTLEARWQDEEIDRFASIRNIDDPFPTPDTASASFDSFSPRVTLDWQLTPNNMIYGVYAEGTKPGGFNGTVAIEAGVPTFEEEEVSSFEIGSKNVFADGQLVLNAAAYFNEVDGYQLTQNIDAGQNAVSATVNAGDADINGLELEMVYRPAGIEGLAISANYAYVDAEFSSGFDENQGVLNDVEDDRSINCSTGDQFPEVDGCQSLFGSIAGKRVPRTAEHMFFADVSYRQPMNNGWDWYVGGNVSYESEKFAQVHNLAEFGDATLLDLRVGFQSDRYHLQLWGKNVTDEDSLASVIRYLDANNFRRAFQGIPRPGSQWGLTFTAEF